MADWPLSDAQIAETCGFVAASTTGATVTSHASANTKGSYTEIIAATQWAGQYLVVQINDVGASGGTAQDTLIDIAIGAAAAETVIVENLLVSQNASTTVSQLCPAVVLPLAIPKGTRLSARCQDSTGGKAVYVTAIVIGGGHALAPTGSRCVTYGATTADSGGTSVDPGASANTAGAAVEFTAAADFDVKAVMLAFGIRLNSAQQVVRFAFDVLTGPATETVRLAGLATSTNNQELVTPALIGPIPCAIPRGTRISLRAQCSLTDANDRLLDAVLYCFS